jgi:hypothetical protein
VNAFSEGQLETARGNASHRILSNAVDYGFRREGSGWKRPCLFHAETSGASLRLYSDGHARCYGACQRNFDGIALWAKLHGLNFVDAVRALLGSEGVTPTPARVSPPQPARPKVHPERIVAVWEASTRLGGVDRLGRAAAVRKYLVSRGLDVGILELQDLVRIPAPTPATDGIPSFAVHPLLVLDHDEVGEPCGLHARRITLGEPRFVNTSTPTGLLLNAPALRLLRGESMPVWFTEGVVDWLVSCQLTLARDVACIGFRSGAGHVLARAKMSPTHAALSLDGDAAGRRYEEAVLERIPAGVPVRRMAFAPREGGKRRDLADAWLEDREGVRQAFNGLFGEAT